MSSPNAAPPSPSSAVPELIERASAIDMMELATATTPAAGQVGAVLLLQSARGLELSAVRAVFAERIAAVPRLRQRLRPVPFGCGRPIWVDDASFDISNHVHETQTRPPGDRQALLSNVAELVAQPLPPGRPLWSATLVSGLADGTTALVIVFHHVMADGMGGLAVLANLVDGAPTAFTPGFPQEEPRTATLLAEAWRTRLRAILHCRNGLRTALDAAAELGIGAPRPRAPDCSLNRPVGPRRCLGVARANLDAVHAAARQHGASVNDAVLAAITGALAKFLRGWGEQVDYFVVSIPVAGRKAATATRLGNQIGIMPVRLPATGTTSARIAATAAITRMSKRAPRAASAAILAPVFRTLAATRTLDYFINRQRSVTTFVTNLRGPEHNVAFMEATVTEIIPINSTSGNVRVAFGVLSYAGALTITVVADESLTDTLPALVAELQSELTAVGAANVAETTFGGSS
ncbi:MAG: wax ester/triacylglycerol synthase domain-containing protein [Ilumatobacteraceae bacterium]